MENREHKNFVLNTNKSFQEQNRSKMDNEIVVTGKSDNVE